MTKDYYATADADDMQSPLGRLPVKSPPDFGWTFSRAGQNTVQQGAVANAWKAVVSSSTSVGMPFVKGNSRRSLDSHVSVSTAISDLVLPEDRVVGSTYTNMSLMALAVVVLATSLCASYAERVDHFAFYILYGCVILIFLAYVILRFLNLVSFQSLVPVSLFFIYVLSLFISLAAPSRQRELLGLHESSDREACEEGTLVMWIALLLALTMVFCPVPARFMFLFGQSICFQHLLLGLVLERPECDATFVPRGGPGGFLFGLPPVWVSSLQLHVLAALFAAMHVHFDSRRKIAASASQYVQRVNVSREHTQLWSSEETDDFVLQHWLEKLVQELQCEEEHGRQFLEDAFADTSLPPECIAWITVVENLLNVLSKCETKLKSCSGAEGRWKKDMKKDLKRALMKPITSGDSHTHNQAIGWIMEAYMDAPAHKEGCAPAYLPRTSLSTSNASDDGNPYSSVASVKTCGSTTSMKSLLLHAVPSVLSEVNIGEWDFDALKVEAENKHVLQMIGREFLKPFDCLAKSCLQGFLQTLEKSYVSSNFYHSHIHGADMCNAFHYLVTQSGYLQLCDLPGHSRVAMFLAALGHDVGHFARNNNFLISTRHLAAITYNDRSVLENFHCATLVRLLDGKYGCKQQDEKQYTRLLAAFSDQQMREARMLMITLILGTDTTKHLEELATFRMRLSAHHYDPLHSAEDQQQALAMLFRAADIGHSAKPWLLHEEWSKRITQEFHEQGDEEKSLGLKVSPLCERDGFVLCLGQIGFLQFVCLPTWSELARFGETLTMQSEMPALLTSDRPNILRQGSMPLLTRLGSNRQLGAAQKQRRPSIMSNNVRTAETYKTSSQDSGRKRSNSALGLSGLNTITEGRIRAVRSVSPRSSRDARASPRVSGVSGASSETVDTRPNYLCFSEVCHSECDKNYQNWKKQADALNSAQNPPTIDVARNACERPSLNENPVVTATSGLDVESCASGDPIEAITQMSPRKSKSQDPWRMDA